MSSARAADGGAEAAAAAQAAGQDAGAQDVWDIYQEEDSDNGEIIADPIEPLNRLVFQFNDKLYFYVAKPVARAYRHLPEPARVSVANFFSNLGAPIRIVNSLLQLKLVDAGNELLRFGVNSTVGIAGLFDPARSYLGIRERDEDFGQTLGSYGAGPGFYLVLPVLGPSSLRDGVGTLVDGYSLDPVIVTVDDSGDSLALKAWDQVNTLSLDKDTYETIKRDALDPYTFIKNAYVQNREARIAK